MHAIRNAIIAIFVVPLLSLCLAGYGGPAMLDQTVATRIHSVEMVGPEERKYLVLGSGPAILFILSGPIAGPALANMQTDFDGKMKDMKVHVADELRQSISDALQKKGYDVTQNVVDRWGANLLFSYSNLGKNADAILDATLIADYVFDGVFSSKLAPYLNFKVRLVDAKTHKPLFSKEYSYGAAPAMMVSDLRYTFPDGNSLANNPQLAAEGLRAGIPLITAQLEQDLSK